MKSQANLRAPTTLPLLSTRKVSMFTTQSRRRDARCQFTLRKGERMGKENLLLTCMMFPGLDQRAVSLISWRQRPRHSRNSQKASMSYWRTNTTMISLIRHRKKIDVTSSRTSSLPRRGPLGISLTTTQTCCASQPRSIKSMSLAL